MTFTKFAIYSALSLAYPNLAADYIPGLRMNPATITLVPQSGSQKSKVKSQNEDSIGFLTIENGQLIYAVLY